MNLREFLADDSSPAQINEKNILDSHPNDLVRENRLRRAQIAATLRLKLPKPVPPDSLLARIRQAAVPTTISTPRALLADTEYWLTRMDSSLEPKENDAAKPGADLVWVSKRIQPTRRLFAPKSQIIGRTWGAEDFSTDWAAHPAALEQDFNQLDYKLVLDGLLQVISFIPICTETEAHQQQAVTSLQTQQATA